MKISYILPVTEDTGIKFLTTDSALEYISHTFESILSQSIPNWELIIVTEKKFQKKVYEIWRNVIIKRSFQNSNDNISYPKNVHFVITYTKNTATACNRGLEICSGKFIASIQAGDLIAETVTYELIKYISLNPYAQFIYTDHDYIDLAGRRFKPFFKPEISPDLLYCQNYINNLVLIKKSLLKRINGWSNKYRAAYDYALNLSVTKELTRRVTINEKHLRERDLIVHIPKILYHQRTGLYINPQDKQFPEPKPRKKDEMEQSSQGLAAVKAALRSEPTKVKVEEIKCKLYRHLWTVPNPEPLVSLIIPTRDGYRILKKCIGSILKETTYKNYEILIIDNQSTDISTIEYMKNLGKEHANIRVLKYTKPFNYSAINNYAATKAKGSILGLINNDTEIITPEWLTEMVSHALRPKIGCVGAMLYYPDGVIQHAGVVIAGDVVDNDFKGLKKNESNYFNFLESIRNPPAVTAAALVIQKSLFFKVGGLDRKNFKIEFNDVDLGLRLLALNYRNIWLPHVEIIHHESKKLALIFYDDFHHAFGAGVVAHA